MGVMSTPNAGGTAPRISLSSGSVGHTASANGNSFRLLVGYHEMTTRHSMAKEKMLRKGPRTLARGCTQGSVSESRSEADCRASTLLPMAVTSATGSRFMLVAPAAAGAADEASVDAGGTNAAHPGRDATATRATASNNWTNDLERESMVAKVARERRKEAKCVIVVSKASKRRLSQNECGPG